MAGSKNGLQYFTSGAEFYPILKKLLRRARQEIIINVYAFHNDSFGQEFVKILSERARAGVRVRIIFDSLGSWFDQRGLLHQLQAAGVEAKLFRDRRTYPWLRPVSFLYRDHARIFLIDRKLFGLGGMGLGDIYYSRQDFFWLASVADGKDIARLFEDLWRLAARPGYLSREVRKTFQISPGIQAMCSGPVSDEQEICRWLVTRIRGAQKRIIIVATWFFPSRELLAALMQARRRGVTITVVTPLVTDREKYDGFRALSLSRLLRHITWYGTQEYFHQKFFIVDEEWALGSANFDILSLGRNYELDVCGRGGETLKRLLANQEDLVAKETPLDHHPTPWIFRHLSRATYGFMEYLFTASPR